MLILVNGFSQFELKHVQRGVQGSPLDLQLHLVAHPDFMHPHLINSMTAFGAGNRIDCLGFK